MPETLWRAHPGPQTRALESSTRELLYGGAAGAGKTDFLVVDALAHVHRHGAHAKALLLRESYPQLAEIVDRADALYPAAGGRYSKSERTWRFPSGGRVLFGHLADGPRPYWGQEYTYLGIDEITRAGLSERDYLTLLARVRSAHGVPCRIRATTNPGGEGHQWVKARWIDVVPPLTRFTDPQTGHERIFIPGRLADNPSLAETDYGKSLEALPDADRRAFLEGDWNAYQGQVFLLEPGIHTWTWAQFAERTGHERPPREWLRYVVMDWGYAKPRAMYWIAVDYDGRAYVYREWYGVARDARGQVQPNVGDRLEPGTVAERIAGIEYATDAEKRERIAMRWTGPDLDQHGRGDHGGGKPISEHFAAQGIYWAHWNAAPGSRVAAKMALHQRLHYERGKDWPGLVFIAEECPHALRTIPALEYDRHRVEDVDTDGEDHAYDAIKGFCLMRPWSPVKLPEPKMPWERRAERKAYNWRAQL